MRLKRPLRSGRPRLTTALVVVAVLVVVLVGGLFHHHESETESAACSCCHAGLQTPVADLGALVTVRFVVVGFLSSTRPSRIPNLVHFSTLIPRAPPVVTHPVVLWEGCGLLA